MMIIKFLCGAYLASWLQVYEAIKETMAKLYFRYGAMGSAKTLNLLAAAHSYRAQGKKILILKPALDDRFGREIVKSRSGLEKEADRLITASSRLSTHDLSGLSCIFVDEAQFLSASFVDHLRQIATEADVPVICYGLRSDFRTHLFDGSRRLIELADMIEEIKSTCHFCNKKAVFNLKLISGRATLEGPTIQLGAEESYLPACSTCYFSKLRSNAKKKSDGVGQVASSIL